MYRIILAAAVAMVISSPALAQEFDVYSSNKHLQYFSKEPLKKSAAKEFKEFKTADYYAVFAYNPENGGWGFHRGLHSLAYAQGAALAICRDYSEENPQGCKLYAQITPRGHKHKKGFQTLNQEASKSYLDEFKGYFSDDATKHFVFAISPEGAWAWKTRTAKISFAETKRKTLESCNEFSLEDRGGDPTWWTEDFKGVADYKCKIIYSKTR